MCTVDVVLFCALTKLQLHLYRALLRSRAVTSCLRSFDSAQHLRCISALKKLCNHAQLLRPASVEMSTDCGDPEVCSVISCAVGILNCSEALVSVLTTTTTTTTVLWPLYRSTCVSQHS